MSEHSLSRDPMKAATPPDFDLIVGETGTMEEVPVVTPEPAKGQQGLNAEPEPTSSEVEPTGDADEQIRAEAREMGWRDKPHWNGEDGKWVDAATFVKNGRQVLPILRAQNRELRERDKQRDQEIADLKRDAQSMAKFFAEQAKQREKFETDALWDERKTALESNNAERVNEIDKELLDRKTKPAAPATEPAREPQADPLAVQVWQETTKRHPWLTEPQSQEDFEIEGRLLRAAGNKQTGQAFVDRVLARLKDKASYADKFRRPPAMVDNGEGSEPVRTNGTSKTWDDLRPEYKNEYARSGQRLGIDRKTFLLNCGPECFVR